MLVSDGLLRFVSMLTASLIIRACIMQLRSLLSQVRGGIILQEPPYLQDHPSSYPEIPSHPCRSAIPLSLKNPVWFSCFTLLHHPGTGLRGMGVFPCTPIPLSLHPSIPPYVALVRFP